MRCAARFQRKSVPAAIVGAVLALTACSSQGAQSSPDEAYEPGVLWSQLEFLTAGHTQERAEQDAVEQQDLVAQCMADQGFEYIPINQNVSVVSFDETYGGPADDTMEFAKQYGYGIIDSPSKQHYEEVSESTDYTDPNQDYVNSLSEAEREAYYLAWIGPGDSVEDIAASETGDYVWDWTKFGCFGWAQKQMDDKSPARFWEDPEFTELVDAINGVWDTVAADPEMEKLEAEWSSCMADEAFTNFPTRSSARGAMWSKYEELAECRGNTCTEPSKEQQDQFMAEEIRQAVADQECAERVNYFERQQKIADRVEQEVVDRYRKQIDAAILKYKESDS